jgi:aryl-alcohol dehydrogenase-like predicted oxidoreductase
MGVITWSPLASGWLTGKIRKGREIPPSPRWEAEVNRPRLEGMHASPGRYRDLLDPTSVESPMTQRKLDVVEQAEPQADAA